MRGQVGALGVLRRVLKGKGVAALVGASLCVTLGGCPGPGGGKGDAVAKVQDPDEALRPGLTQLLPYDFAQGRTARGMRWLENHATLNPRSASAARARWWLVRARLDWMTHAYLAPSQTDRGALLLGLMDNVGVKHPGRVDNDSLFGLLESLERQVEGLKGDPSTAQAAEGAAHLVKVFKHLDRSAPYAAGINGLRGAQGGAAIFEPNALLVALVDVYAGLDEINALPPDRIPHGLSALAGFACPVGLESLASSTMEARHEAIGSLCEWPCGWAPRDADDRAGALKACGESLVGDPAWFSPDNELVLRILADLAVLDQQTKAMLEAHGEHPLLALHAEKVTQWLRRLEKYVFLLSVPEYKGQTGGGVELANASYAGHPGLLYAIIESEFEGPVKVSMHPVAQLRGGELTLNYPWDGAETYAYPGPSILHKGVNPLTRRGEPDVKEAIDAVLKPIDEMLSGFRQGMKVPEGQLGPEELIPGVALDRRAPGGEALMVAEVLRAGGFKAMDLLVSDPVLHRAGVLRMSLEGQPEVKVLVESGQTVVELPGGKRQVLAHVDGAVDLAGVYRAVVSRSDALMERPIALLGVGIAPEVPYRELIALLDVLRFRRQISDGMAPAKALAAPIEGEDVPFVLCEGFLLLP